MSDMRIPIRPAPEPPKLLNSKGNSNRDPFPEHIKLSRSQSVGRLGDSKKPPPRPPPPLKLKQNLSTSTVNFPKQPSHLLSTLFTHNKATKVVKSHTSIGLADIQQTHQQRQTTSCGMLIDLSSPPSSPTHSSSDGFSLNSFGSDSVLMGLNNTNSQIESGFEDDFDALITSNSTTPNISDPWSIDCLSPAQPRSVSVPFELSNEDPKSKHKCESSTTSVSVKPTIIRAKNTKPARPPPPRIRPFSTPPTFVSAPSDIPIDWSPPMPSVPPPPPPPEVIETLQNGPSVPPRPTELIQENAEKKKPYCIALYDYDASHPEDLSFKKNDVIHLTERINADWLRGSLCNKEGMFPASYTKVVVPLDDTGNEYLVKHKYVIALYNFNAETWDDLPFQEGDTVKVTKRLNRHWLYGECNGKQGQFPENYVTDVTSILSLEEINS